MCAGHARKTHAVTTPATVATISLPGDRAIGPYFDAVRIYCFCPSASSWTIPNRDDPGEGRNRRTDTPQSQQYCQGTGVGRRYSEPGPKDDGVSDRYGRCFDHERDLVEGIRAEEASPLHHRYRWLGRGE